jgi:hypothetical protein
MNPAPPLRSTSRAPRAHLAGVTPAVLRFPDGRRIASELQIVSCTGGLLSLSHTVSQGSQVKLMFLGGGGSVLGGAEMLGPVTSTLQPFRFLSLGLEDRRRVGAMVQASAQNSAEERWIAKLRAASPLYQETPSTRLVKRAMGAVGFITLGLAAVMYLIQPTWLK